MLLEGRPGSANGGVCRNDTVRPPEAVRISCIRGAGHPQHERSCQSVAVHILERTKARSPCSEAVRKFGCAFLGDEEGRGRRSIRHHQVWRGFSAPSARHAKRRFLTESDTRVRGRFGRRTRWRQLADRGNGCERPIWGRASNIGRFHNGDVSLQVRLPDPANARRFER